MSASSLTDAELLAEMLRRGFLEPQVILEFAALPPEVRDAMTGVERQYSHEGWRWVLPVAGGDLDFTKSIERTLEPFYQHTLRLARTEDVANIYAKFP